MTCPACDKAAREPAHSFIAGCDGCKARAASRSPHFARVRKAMDTRDWGYRELLRQFNLTHEQIKAAAEADALNKVAT